MDKNLANLNKLDKKIYALTERTGLKLALFLIASMTTLSGSIIAPALPAIAEKFRATPHIDILAPLVMSLPALFVALTAPLAGALMDRFGRLRLLYAGMLAWSAAGVAGAWCESLYALLATRALFGIATAFVMNGANVLVADYFSIGSRREVALSAQNAVMAFMGVSMSIAVGALAGVSSEACFLVYGVGVVIWAVGLPYLFEPRRGKGNSSFTEGHSACTAISAESALSTQSRTSSALNRASLGNPQTSGTILECLAESSPKDSKEISESTASDSHSVIASVAKQSTDSKTMDCHTGKPARNDSKTESTPHASLESSADSRQTKSAREVARLCGAVAMGAFACIIFYICPTQMPFILTHSLRLSPTLTGALLSLPALHYGLIALGYKRIHARLGIVRVFVLACALDGAGFALLASSQHLGAIMLAFALIGAGSGLLSINASAWLFSFAPVSVRARYFGYLAGAIFLGQFLSPLISQPLVRLIGVGATLWAAAIACLCVGAVWAGVRRGDSRRGGIL